MTTPATPRRSRAARPRPAAGAAVLAVALVTACGGGSGDASDPATPTTPASPASAPAPAGGAASAPTKAPVARGTSRADAFRLADQASFGATEALTDRIVADGPAAWIGAQMALKASRYTSGEGGAVHQWTGEDDFCADKGENCWRDWSSTEPLLWDFYRNATRQPDQLRQRVAFALQQIVVVSSLEVGGTYGFRRYHNDLLDNAFGNYREVLRRVALSPVMGDFLNNANNDKAAPNENFARELLQLFSIGTCELEPDGSLRGGVCNATYTNATVRAYAYALTGWTYPAGGATAWGCWPEGMHCRYYGGDMVATPSAHDSHPRRLLSGVTVAAGGSAGAALEAVLDSLMAHPNMAPFIGRQLIQHLVGSNPSPAYVARVARAFTSGRFQTFGSGHRGDLAATVAAILLDAEARGDQPAAQAGKLREPVLMFTGVLRALNGRTDGDALGWWWGDALGQHVFRPPSVFNFFSPNYPVAGTRLAGPEFAIHGADAALQRLDFLTYLLDWNGSEPAAGVPNAVGTRVDLSAFLPDAGDPARLVDRLSFLATGTKLPAAPRAKAIEAVGWWTAATDAEGWRDNRVRTAAYLVFASPNYQIQR